MMLLAEFALREELPLQKSFQDFRSLARVDPLNSHGITPDRESRYNSAMSPNAQKVLEEARQLTPDEQDWLVESLLIRDETEVSAAWDEEIKRRLDEIDSGAVQMVTLDDVLARMEARRRAKQEK
jgi:putative addiction module component (TIGR02574 family)